MERDIIDIVELMDAPRLSERIEIERIVRNEKRILYALALVFNYGKMKGKQEVRDPRYRTLKRISRKYGEKYREPKMTVHQFLTYYGSSKNENE